jgi:arabinofuranan 3-O-arabinosyltransferase
VLFAHGGAPYSVKAYVYPPSCLLILRPLAAFNQNQISTGGLVATTLIALVGVMISAKALGFRWWGPTAAFSTLALSLFGAMRGELPLENVSVIEFLALALFFGFVLRKHWLAGAVVIGLALCIKPLLLAVLIIFLISRKWKAFFIAAGIPVVLNGVAFALIANPGQALKNLPSILNRSGSGVSYNSAWVDVARILGLPDGVAISLRVVTVLLVIAATWLAWTRLKDERLKIVTATSVLLMGVFLAGTLSEYHFMLTLIPFGMTLVIPRSPMRTVTAVVSMLWVMNALAPPAALFGIDNNARDSAFRAIGMSIVIITVVWVLARRDSPESDDEPGVLIDSGVTRRSDRFKELAGSSASAS